jgi:hypothetical protein
LSTNGSGWHPDPTGRHQYRWWDGTVWSDAVADQGVERRDPIGGSAPVAQPQQQPPVSGGYAPAQQQPPVSGGYAPAQQQPPTSGGYAPAHFQQASSGGPSGGFPPGAAASPGGPRGRRPWAANAVLAVLGAVIAGALVVLGVAVANRDDGGDDQREGSGDGAGEAGGATGPAPGVDPRDALITVGDLPAGWTESQNTYPPGENQVCEPRLEPPSPPRSSDRSFDRATPAGAITHRVVEYSPEFAADYLAEARRQAGECGTFETETQTGGESQRFTGTSELLTGPSIGDETLWYRILVQYQEPEPSTHAVLVVLDRHGGVISGFTMSTTSEETSATDRQMVEDLARVAADRLDGGGRGAGGGGDG